MSLNLEKIIKKLEKTSDFLELSIDLIYDEETKKRLSNKKTISLLETSKDEIKSSLSELEELHTVLNDIEYSKGVKNERLQFNK